MVNFPVAPTIREILSAYRAGLRPTELVRIVLARARRSDDSDSAVWICLQDEARLMARAKKLEAIWNEHGESALTEMPLFGVPFAVKDNVDAAGLPTTVGCPAFVFNPEESATVVRRLEAAGAILIGKTNMDQFATGLVGTRSPYGVVRNPFNEDYISAGSSSGSAAAVAQGLVSFSLGTDTAGSGRVTAAFCNLVRLKPSRGLVSIHGVFPACRTLDCVSIFALDVDDAWTVLKIIAGEDSLDSFSSTMQQVGPLVAPARIGVPDSLDFFGDRLAADAFDRALAKIESCERIDQLIKVDFQHFKAAAQLLYRGAWVAERRAALGEFFSRGDGMDPSVRQVIAEADRYSAVDAFNDVYRLADLRRHAKATFRDIDVLLLPTAPTIYSIDEIQKTPIALNSNLGYYTNFVNLLDLCALALPAGFRSDGLPFGISLVPRPATTIASPNWLELSNLFCTSPRDYRCAPVEFRLDPLPTTEATTRLAVVGAHLSGQPLNWQLIARSARLVATTTTAAEYKLYALPGTVPPKPGLVRVLEPGARIEVEVWEMPTRHFGSFVAAIPSPLGIGTLRLADNEEVKGFICEPWVIAGAEQRGGWRRLSRCLARRCWRRNEENT
jgi:allophanate hydrolase